MESGHLKQVKVILKSLITSSPARITVGKLNQDYIDFEGESIPFRRLGFNSLENFLRSIPDTLIVNGRGDTASIHIVANEKSLHIHKMVMEQKKPKVRVGRRPRQENIRRYEVPPRFRNRRNYNNFQAASLPRRPMGQQPLPLQTRNGNVSSRTTSLRNDMNDRSQFRPNIGCCKQTPSKPGNFAKRTLAYALAQPAGIEVQNSLNKTHIREPIKSVETSVKQNNPETNPFKTDKIPEIIHSPLSTVNTTCHVTTSALVVPKKVKFSVEAKDNPIKRYTKEALLDIQANTRQETATQLTQQLQSDLNGRTRYSLNRTEAKQMDRMTSILIAAENEYEINVNQFKELLDINDTKLPNLGAAVPEFAVDIPVCRLDFPNYTVHFGHKIPSFKMPDNLNVGTCIGIFIAEIHNPFKFWFHIYKEEHELDLLMNDIELFYTSLEPHELRIPDKCLVPGQVCAASFRDLWHRAEIVEPAFNNKVKVFFVDYGTVALVSIMEIKMLVSWFADLPAQAMRACLSHIKPRGPHWSLGATMHFLSTVEEKLLFAKITEIDTENMIYHMILCDTYNDEVIQINKELVAIGYALYNKDWQDKKIVENNGRRNHHPREDYPTFSMIESGKYPTFGELIELDQCGIDYEWIHDKVLMNKSAILNFQENVPDPIKDLPFFLLTSNPFRTDILFELTGIKASG